jgi:hypothetical protein
MTRGADQSKRTRQKPQYQQGNTMNTKRIATFAGLAALAVSPIGNEALAQVRLPNGQMTGPNLVQLHFWAGQDDGHGSGMVLGSAHQTPSGAYNIYIYTGTGFDSPQKHDLWGQVPLDPTIVPPSTVQNKCQATLANVYALPESDIIGNTYNYGYGVTDWPFPATIQMDGSQRGDPAHGPEQTNGNLVVNIYVRYDYSTLDPGSVYVINLLCPPVPPPSDTYD